MKKSSPVVLIAFGIFILSQSLLAQKSMLKVNAFGPPVCKDTQYTLLPTEANISFTIIKPSLSSCAGNTIFQLSGDLGSSYIQTNIPTGIYQVMHNIIDTCGGEFICSSTITIKDITKPKQHCYPLYIGIQYNNQDQLYINKYQLKDNNSTDNNSIKSELIYRVEKLPATEVLVPSTDSITFECQEINGNVRPIRVWVGDKGLDLNKNGIIDDSERNWDYCDSQIQLMDFDGVCGEIIEYPFAFVTFKLKDTYGKPVAGVTIENKQWQGTTDSSGYTNLIMNPLFKETFQISSPEQMLSKVTVADFLLIKDFILGKKPFGSYIKQYAADVNGTLTVSPTDLVRIRAVLLGKSSANNFERGKYNYLFPIETNPDSFYTQLASPFIYPWTFVATKSSILLNNPYIAYDTINMTLLEIGDVSYTGTGFANGPNETRTSLPVVFEEIESGKYAAIYRGEDDKTGGFINAKTESNEILTANVPLENINQSNSETRIIFDESIHPGEVLFILESTNNPILKNYQGSFVSNEYSESEISWSLENKRRLSSTEFIPNPNYGQSQLHVNLLAESIVSISIYTSDGKFVSTPIANQKYAKGAHKIQLNENLENGMYLAVINLGTEQLIRKLINFR